MTESIIEKERLANRLTPDPELPHRLERTWRQPGGIWGWFSNTDHKAIGVRFMVTAFIFFLLGGILAALIRLQLMRPENSFLGPEDELIKRAS